MKILAIDTASKIASVAIIENSKVIAQLHDETEKEHSISLMPMIKRILEEANITLDNIDLIATNIGPRIIYRNTNRNSNSKSIIRREENSYNQCKLIRSTSILCNRKKKRKL